MKEAKSVNVEKNASLVAQEKDHMPAYDGIALASPIHENFIRGQVSPQAPIQPKLVIGRPDDRYEREADAIAGQVMRKLGGGAAPNVQAKSVRFEEGEQIQSRRPPESNLSSQNSAVKKKNNGKAAKEVVQKKALGESDIRKQIEGDQVYEFLAHGIAYQNYLNPLEVVRLAETGFIAKPLVEGEFDLQMRGFVPSEPLREEGKIPILAFRGTEFSLSDVRDDFNSSGIGSKQLIHNKVLIEKEIESLGGMVDVTGHSLGGALAQLTAAFFPDKVRRVVTFQSPGISAFFAKKLKMHNKKLLPGQQVRSTHYRVANGLVPEAGEAFTPGEALEISFDKVPGREKGKSALSTAASKHTSFPLRDLIDLTNNNNFNNVEVTRRQAEQDQTSRPVEELRMELAGIVENGIVGLSHKVDDRIRGWIKENKPRLPHLKLMHREVIIEILLKSWISNDDVEAIVAIIRSTPNNDKEALRQHLHPLIKNKGGIQRMWIGYALRE